MPNFRYELRQSSGQVSAGVIAANTSTAAAQMLRAQGGYILSLLEVRDTGKSGLNSILSFKVQTGPSAKDVLNFTQQMAVMIKAGISIRAALEGIVDQVENDKFRNILQQIRRDVEAGKSFSDALAKYPKVFSPLYINMVRASELSGSFGAMLERIAGYLAQQIETRSMVRGAMIYPAIIAVMAVVTTVFMLTYVLPKFVVIFEGKEAALPAPTKIILGISYVVRTYWYAIVGVLAGCVWTFLWVINTDWGRMWWDKIKLIMPIFKKLFRCLYISRSMHTMGELVNAGVPMLDTISITANIAGNTIYKRMWHKVFVAVKQGKKISDPLSRSRLLPKSVIQMIGSGEESGKLADVLRDISEYYQKELKSVIRTVTALIEPVMIILMGFVVGFIAMSIILPVFKLSSLVKG
ncbi:MAG: type II secretion system F family protein [Sedimentisphaerales bacterium]|nr:type II secretion system F family protein [Sedimentisphaerales bacterium]